MFLFKRVRFVGVLVVAASLPFAALAQPATAELVDRFHERISLTFPDDNVCGIPVVTTVEGVANSQERLSKSGFPLYKSTGRGTVTSTNPENGKSIVITFAGPVKDLTAVDNGDGTVTVRTAITGLAEAIRLADGTVATKDVGRIVIVTVLDYGGTPRDPIDDVIISVDVESMSGPHPQYESGFGLFCDIVVPALT